MAEKKSEKNEKCEETCYNEYWVGLEQEVPDPDFEAKYRKCVTKCDIR